MLIVKKFLRWSYGSLAFVFLWVIGFNLLAPFRTSRATGHSSVSTIVIGMAFASVLIFAMAWWSIRNGNKWARVWALTASSVLILTVLPMFFFARYLPRDFIIIYATLLAVGISGLVVFGPRNALGNISKAAAKLPRIAGDGTSGLLDQATLLAAVAGYFAGQFMWARWGRAQHFPFNRGLLFWFFFLAAALIETALHEAGHATAGLALGMKLRIFLVGPFQWRVRDGRWKFQFLPGKFLSLGGAAGVVPTNPRQSLWCEICMIAAGPLASLCTGLIALVAALHAKGTPYEPAWQFLSFVATFGLVSFAVNLVPVRPEALYSDGARIYQLLSGGQWADLHRALAIVQSTAVTPLRPRDYDIEAIQRASRSFTQGRQALLLRLLASSHFLDSGNLPQAREALAEAESIYQESARDIPADLYTVFVFDNAFLRRDAASARLWWDRMETKKPTHFGFDYWLARSALFWIEDQQELAREAWDKSNNLAERLPTAGTYEFDRHRVSLLRRAMDRSAQAAHRSQLVLALD
jgi:hypothetical protein